METQKRESQSDVIVGLFQMHSVATARAPSVIVDSLVAATIRASGYENLSQSC
jgi:hypothetical protein